MPREAQITYEGKTQCLSAWARELGINPSTLNGRLRNWPLDKALTTKNMGMSGTKARKDAMRQRTESIRKTNQERKNARIAISKLRHLFDDDEKLHKLWFSVLELAILDLFNRYEKDKAKRWLEGPMDNMQLTGVDPDYIRRVLRTMEVM